MNSVRLLPVVMVVASTLLLFKLFGFVTGDLYVFGSREAIAQEAETAAEGDAAMEEGTDAAEQPTLSLQQPMRRLIRTGHKMPLRRC